jgi:hypothetical protein
MNIFQALKSCYQFEGKLVEGLIFQNGAQLLNLIFALRIIFRKLAFKEEIDEIAEGIYPSSACHDNHLTWFEMCKLESLSFGFAKLELDRL